MDALKFMNEFARMCNHYNRAQAGCGNCPLADLNCELTSEESSKKLILKVVERWSEEHPRKTRQSEFLKMFPRAKTLSDGILTCMPCEADCEVEQDCHCNFGCSECRKNYWLREVE